MISRHWRKYIKEKWIRMKRDAKKAAIEKQWQDEFKVSCHVCSKTHCDCHKVFTSDFSPSKWEAYLRF